MKPKTPWVTLFLVTANLVMAFVTTYDPDLLRRLAFLAVKPTLGQAFSSMFIHQSNLHLLGNMVFLAAVGPYVESAIKWWKFAILYLVGGLVGAFTHALVYGQIKDETPYLGASACVAACIGYGALRFFRQPVPLAPKVMVPVWLVAMLWLVMQVAGHFMHVGQAGGTAYIAHVGGLLFGLVMAVVLRADTQAHAEASDALLAEMHERGPAARKAAAEQRLRDSNGDDTARLHLAESLLAMGEPEESVPHWVILSASNSADKRNAAIEALSRIGKIDVLPSITRMQLVPQVSEANALLLYKSIVNSPNDPERPHALLALASQGVPGPWFKLLMQEYPLDPAADLARKRGLA